MRYDLEIEVIIMIYEIFDNDSDEEIIMGFGGGNFCLVFFLILFGFI